MKLVDNAKHAWCWISMQAMVAAGAIQGAWLYLPDELRLSLGPGAIQGITLALLVLGVIGRLVDQPATHQDKSNSKCTR